VPIPINHPTAEMHCGAAIRIVLFVLVSARWVSSPRVGLADRVAHGRWDESVSRVGMLLAVDSPGLLVKINLEPLSTDVTFLPDNGLSKASSPFDRRWCRR